MIYPEHEYFPQGQVLHGFVPLVMGTKLELIICKAPKELCETLWERMCGLAQKLETMMNRFDPESEVSRINAAGQGEMSPEMAEAVDLCEHYRISTGGLFDIGRGTVDWGKALSKGGFISLNGGNLDFGGFGKGFLLKKFKEMMQETGITAAYVDFGGSSIMAIGHHPYGNCWKVGVADPFTRTTIREIELQDMSMSTSGNQPGYDGHITDPRNGTSVTGRKIVTILSEDPLTAEVISTAAMIAGENELAFIKENNDIAEILGLSTTPYGK